MNFLKNKKTAQALSVAAISLVALTACGGGSDKANTDPSASTSVTATATASSSDSNTVQSLSGQVPEGLTNDKDNLNETEKKSIETFTKYVEKVYADKDNTTTVLQSMIDETAKATATQPENLEQLVTAVNNLPEEERKALADKLVEVFPHDDFFDFSGMNDSDKTSLLLMLGSFESELTSADVTLSDFKVTERSGVYQDSEGSVYLVGLGTKETNNATGESTELPEETWFETKFVDNGEKISGEYWLGALDALSNLVNDATGGTATESGTTDVTVEETEITNE